MNPVFAIQKKRDGGALSRGEIAEFISGYVQGTIPDHQMAALAMAIYFRGMEPAEIAGLTAEMLASGATLQPAGNKPRVDKHSTGGIGDKTSLILAPLLACFDVHVPMLSGRGLGATGGTLDKLEAIPGYRTDLSEPEIRGQLEHVGCVITGQTADIVPADKRLYALRDVTATVPSLPLITASIMSKKLAENLDALVLDVKWGSGAFMKTLSSAEALAKSLIAVGQEMGLRTTALLTDMNQPLGRMAGNAVEVVESLDVLQGKGPTDVRELTLLLAAELLISTGLAPDVAAAKTKLAAELDSGRALAKFHEMVAAQGGDAAGTLSVAPASEVLAARGGFIAGMNCEQLGYAVIALGGGRTQLGEKLDFSVGFEMLVRIGDEVRAGQPLVRLFANQRGRDEAKSMIEEALVIGNGPPVAPLPLVVKRLISD